MPCHYLGVIHLNHAFRHLCVFANNCLLGSKFAVFQVRLIKVFPSKFLFYVFSNCSTGYTISSVLGFIIHFSRSLAF